MAQRVDLAPGRGMQRVLAKVRRSLGLASKPDAWEFLQGSLLGPKAFPVPTR